jgi:hypothetical protein
MKVQKFYEFLFEGNTPEDYIHDVLTGIERRLLPVFDEEEVKKFPDFKNYNLQLQNSKISTYNPVEKSYKLKFTDDAGILYIYTVFINLKDAIPMNPDTDFKLTDIKKAQHSFDKYEELDGRLNLINRILANTVDPEDINPELLIKLKIDLDKGEVSKEEEEFEIEAESGETKAGQIETEEIEEAGEETGETPESSEEAAAS